MSYTKNHNSDTVVGLATVITVPPPLHVRVVAGRISPKTWHVVCWSCGDHTRTRDASDAVAFRTRHDQSCTGVAGTCRHATVHIVSQPGSGLVNLVCVGCDTTIGVWLSPLAPRL
jgi:hypothetical protein